MLKKRGIVASREKLEKALQKSDLDYKTQKGLAEAIADLEDLDNVPKDMVNRAFREMPVDPKSIERIAVCLGVEAHQLYKSSSELLRSPTIPLILPIQQKSSTRYKRLSWGAGVIFSIGLMVSFLLNTPTGNDLQCKINNTLNPVVVEPDRLSLLIISDTQTTNVTQRIVDYVTFNTQLDNAIQVILACEKQPVTQAGNVSNVRRAERTKAQTLVKNYGTDSGLYIQSRQDNWLLNFVFGNQANNTTIEFAEKSLPVDGDNIDITFQPGDTASLDSALRIAISSMMPKSELLQAKKQEVLQYIGASDSWLTQSINAERIYLQSLDKTQRAAEWIRSQSVLCYRYRLLGDVRSDKSIYELALQHCSDAYDYAESVNRHSLMFSLLINKASALTRLHVFASSREQSHTQLLEAEDLLQKASQLINKEVSPPDWATLQQSWGNVLVRLGETTSPERQSAFYERAIKKFNLIAAYYDPHIQANEFASINQNLCAAQYLNGEILSSQKLFNDAKTSCLKAQQAVDSVTNVSTWTMVTNNLAIVYALSAGLSKSDDDFENAILTFSSAQSLQKQEQAPLHWASVETNKGQLYCEWSNASKDKSKLQFAIDSKQRALQVFFNLSTSLYADVTEKLILQYQQCLNNESEVCECE